jgi:hypothetical protein
MRNVFALILTIVSLAGCAAYDKSSFFDPSELEGASREEVRAKDVGVDFAFEASAAAKAPGKTGAVSGSVGGQAGSTPPLLVPPPASAPGTDARQVVYSAAFRVVVADVAGSLSTIREQAEKLGGYLQEVSGGSITVRVPAARFNDAVAFVEKVGEVVDRQLRAQDVTEELRDLRTHIDNCEKLRQRFQELLAKAEKVEDALKIETELARVTEELDKTKGKLRALEAQVSMSSIRVDLNSPLPQNPRGNGPHLPFAWVGELGEGLVEGQVKQTVRRAGIFGHGPRFKPPTAFVRYYEDDSQVEAMDAGDLRLRVLRRENVDKASLAFWSSLVRRSLVEGRSLNVTGEETGKDFYTLRGTRDVGGKTLGYLLALERNDRRVVVFEAWGPREQFDQQLDMLRTSALSIDPR